ncbi:MAG: methyl-accepting chemotaxis protein [Spirochaetales bacterium]|nr:methyl-accepting chemotaxis protein [Spirochaetales bacterium]
MKVKYKFLISFGIVIALIAGILLLFFYYTSEGLILSSIKSQIRNVSKNIVLNYKKNVTLAIKNYLRAISESMVSELKSYYKQVQEKKLKKTEAINQIERKISEKTVGKTGYLFILNTSRTPVITFEMHPLLKNQDASEYDFVQQIGSKNEGYIEYRWKEFGEIYDHKKALYFIQFPGWNWILCTTVIIEELNYLLTTEDLKDDIASLEKNKGESISIIDDRGNVLYHDIYEGDNIYDNRDIKGYFYIREICKNKTGELTYQVIENNIKENKLVIYEYYEEMNWIFLVDNYLKEIFRPLYVQTQNIIIFIVIIAIVFILLLLFGYSIVFLKPINTLRSILTQSSKGNLAVAYPLKKIDYSSRGEFDVNDFKELKKEKSYCFFEIGSFAPEIGQETRCPALLSGKYRNCPGCFIYRTICDNEFNEIGAWFNYFISSLQEIEKSANVIAEGNLTKNIVNQSLKGDLGKAFMMMSKNLYEIISKVQIGIIELVSNTKEIHAAVEEQKAASTEQASSITEVSATLGELSITAKQITMNASELVMASGEVVKELLKGQELLVKTVTQLGEAGQISETNANQIGELGKRSELINELVEIIKEVANKTNILAINASIEASRAGETGKGFSIIAAEIRELSKETITTAKKAEVAAKDITAFINSIITSSRTESKRVVESVDIAKSLHTSLKEVVENINNNYIFTQKIDISIKQQENGSKQAAETMTQMAKIAKESAEIARQIFNSINNIVNMSKDLEISITKFNKE